jgi:hypothetical protein
MEKFFGFKAKTISNKNIFFRAQKCDHNYFLTRKLMVNTRKLLS